MTEQQTTEDQKTIKQFIADHGLTMTSEPVPENPNMSGSSDGMQHYHCTLEGAIFSMNTYYSVGSGIVESWLKKHGPVYHRQFLITAPHTIGAKRYVEVNGKEYRPKLPDVLNCLAMDASGMDESFEDWADNYGYDTDSRKAETIYKACQDNARQLRVLLGHEAFDVLVNEIERL